jgi:hypothetical protein
MAKIKWSEQDVLDAFIQAQAQAALQPSPQDMYNQLMQETQMEETNDIPAKQ